MFCFLETDVREQKKFEKYESTKTGNDLHYEIKFENCAKDKNNLFIKRNFAFLF